jgi:phospholipase C
MADENQLAAIEHMVVLILENRSFDHIGVPASSRPSPVAGSPSHLQQVQAGLVAALRVDAGEGTSATTPPGLVTEQDYDDYVRSRTHAWVAQHGAASP